MKIACCFLLFEYSALFAFAPDPPLEIKQLNGTIVLDGVVNESAWQKISPFQLVTHWPVFGNDPSDSTEIRMTYDSQYIYFSGIMKTHPYSLKAIPYKRDLWTSGTDYLTLILDTYNDNETALYFTTSPTGSRTDCIVSNDANSVDPSWNTFWEADDQQVNLTRFSLFFPEKRRFFLERSNIFDFNFSGSNRLFYSRQIGLHDGEHVSILGGVRLTGRVDDWDVGVLNVQTGHEKSSFRKFCCCSFKKACVQSAFLYGGNGDQQD